MSRTAVIKARGSVLDLLNPMIEKAKANMLFFRSRHRGVILTPEKLQEEHARGRYIWGPEHWHLVDATGKRVA